MSTDLTALDHRIAIEFMGWILDPELACNFYIKKEDLEKEYDIDVKWDSKFSPTTDMRAAYVVLEKINKVLVIGEMEISFVNYIAKIGEYSAGIISNVGHIDVCSSSAPLAISLLAEQIMNSPEHMALFKE